MEQFTVSDREEHCRYIAYIAGALTAVKERTAHIEFEDGRVIFTLRAEPTEPEFRKLAEDRIADVICIGYKYSILSGQIAPAGLNAQDREILLTAVIAADFAEDKKYVLSRLAQQRTHTIDGFFNFRLKELREKWLGVAACVPPVFTRGQLTEFMRFLLNTNRGKVFLKRGEVYDVRCRRLRRSALIGDASAEMNTLREIVLSGAGKVECLGSPTALQENFLKRFYEGRVSFG